jgi:CPA2 family monovalent cation:H+ antiporter-2
LAGALALFWRRLVRWHSQMEISLNTVLESGDSSAKKVRQVTALQDETDWEVELSECVLPSEAACSGLTLASLNLRAKHGCVVVEVERQGMPIENPGPDLRLFPEDKLLLFGPEEKIQSARRYLSRTKSKNFKEDEFDETVLETIQVPGDSPHVGLSLVELKIFPRTGVQVLGIERGDRKILNPVGTETLEAGDKLLIMATPNEEKRFLKWLEKT